MFNYARHFYSRQNVNTHHGGSMSRRVLWLNQNKERVIMNGLQLISKYQLVPFYMIIIYISIATLELSIGSSNNSESSIWNQFLTTCSIVHAMRGGLISYIVAVSTGTLALLFLRMLSERMDLFMDRTVDNFMSQETSKTRTNSIGFRSPPISAFKKIPWKESHLNNADEDEVHSDIDPYDESIRLHLTSQFCVRDTLSIDRDTNDDKNSILNQSDTDKGHIFPENYPGEAHLDAIPSHIGFSDILHFEVCVLSIILWVPIFTLPIFHVRAKGVLSYLMDTSYGQSKSINLWEILGLLMKSGDSTLFNMITLLFILHQTILCPVILVACYIKAWYREEMIRVHRHTSKRLWEHYIYQSSSSIPFVIGAVVVLKNLQLFNEHQFNQSYICDQLMKIFHLMNQEKQTCLILEARVGAGLWFLLVEGLCLEILFIIYIK